MISMGSVPLLVILFLSVASVESIRDVFTSTSDSIADGKRDGNLSITISFF